MRRVPASRRARREPALATAALPVALLVLVVSACAATGTPTSRRPGSHRERAAPPTTATASGGSRTSVTPAGGRSAGKEGVPAFSHVFLVVMENLSEPGALATPSIASLSRQYAISTAYYAVSHPSLPNYLALVSGSTWGTSSDCTDCYVEGANLASQLKSAGISWGAYFEGMPGPCFTGPESGGTYAKKHDPFVYFDDVRADTELCSHVQPFSSLTPLLSQDASAVPRLVWVTPDLCNDGHDCPASVAGQWLSRFVSEVTASAAWRQGGVLFVTWDEGTDDSGVDPSTGAVTSSGGGGHVLTIVVAPGVPRGTEVSGAFDHYSLLRTVEDALGLPLLGEAGAPGVHPMTAFWSG